MPGFFKRLLFSLKGDIPVTSKFEARRASLEKKYEKYNALKHSDNLLRYNELAAQIVTPRRQSGLPKKDWKEMKQEFARLRKSAEIVDFFKLQKATHNFHAITDWDLVFEDGFKGGKLDAAKWITHPYVADQELLYSPADEQHLYTDGANIAMTGETLKIVTKPEQASGLVFGKTVGFINVERNYTSGIINTGKSYAQQYGKVEAKIRFSQPVKGVYHAMWLGAQRMLPRINIVRIGSKVEFSACAEGAVKDEMVKHVDLWTRIRFRQNAYYIYSLEWNEHSITWKVNGATMFTTPNVVKEPLYIGFSSGVTGKPNGHAQAVLEVDWVKAYRRHETAAV